MVLIKRDKGTRDKEQEKKAATHLPLTFFVLLFILLSTHVSAQTFDADRVTAWENAGLTTVLQAPENQVSVLDFGADNTGQISSNAAYTSALASLNGAAGTVYFPTGEYLFNAAISIPDSVFIKGESADTELKFNLGGTGNLIVMNGGIYSPQYPFAANAVKGSYEVELADAGALQAGDMVRFYQFDEDLMFSSWAYGTLGQVVQLTAVNGNTITLADPLNHHYPLTRNPYLKKLNPRVAAGIECLKIERLDASVGQTSNIYVGYAFNCVVRNVESENCNFGHMEVNSSAHVQIEGCYFHHAFAYGGGGQGYGLVFQVASSFCLGQNNNFEHLRHSMLIQSGANGNVFGYNCSKDAYWTEGGFFPNNSAGDAVLHGNYTYMNLFEGNTIQNIVVDASHGKNGPFNTFFRNRAELYGFFSDASTTSDSMNVVGNEITNSGFPLGMFSVSGVGHYSYGNNVNGTANPTNTSNVPINSLYLNETALPAFLSNQSLPMAGYPLSMNQKLLPSEVRAIADAHVNCEEELVTAVAELSTTTQTAICWSQERFEVDAALLPARLSVYGPDGKLLHQQQLNATSTQLQLHTTGGIVLLRVEGAGGKMESLKLFLTGY